MAKRKNKFKNLPESLIFKLSYAKFSVNVNEDFYSKEDKQEILDIIKIMSRHIIIDKSYVNCNENKHNDVFINEEGWNEFEELILKTKFGNKCTQIDNSIIIETYRYLMIEYLYRILDLYGYDVEYITISMKDDSKFMVEISFDLYNEWKKYPGKWQTWKCK